MIFLNYIIVRSCNVASLLFIYPQKAKAGVPAFVDNIKDQDII